jgi:hypothetical protein
VAVVGDREIALGKVAEHGVKVERPMFAIVKKLVF